MNHCFTRLKSRQERAHVEVEADAAPDEPALQVPPVAERRLQLEDERQRIADALAAMNDTLRVPLVLRDADDLSYQEIAEQLGIGVSAAKMRVKRGREAFRAAYLRDREEPGSAA